MPEIELVAESSADAVWIGPPARRHAEHAIAALRAGRHVILEKPMALTLADAETVIAAARDADRLLLAGYSSYTYQLPIRAMRSVACSGRIGRPRAVFIWSATDWMLRPRPADESDPEGGTGLVHRQAPHQIETLRLLGPARLRSVRAEVGDWSPGGEPCFYTALFTYEDGMTATILHNGQGYVMTLDFFPEAAAYHPYDDAARVALRNGTGAGAKVGATSPEQPWSPIDVGLVVLSCERGDLRHSPHGLWLVDDAGRHALDLRPLLRERLRGETDLGGGPVLQALLELKAAVDGVAPLVHDGAWGKASLEVTLALIDSAHEHREVTLSCQTVLPSNYDAGLGHALSSAEPPAAS
jgi:phthalate 4,5-cis-dihydrodiol dehydrogenase